jgi:hypothetical protein
MIGGGSALNHVHNGWVKLLGPVFLFLFMFNLPFDFFVVEIVRILLLPCFEERLHW